MSTPQVVSKSYSLLAADSLPPVADDEVWAIISDDTVDRSREVVIQGGMDWSFFLSTNPVVTYEHSDENANAYLLPIGRAVEIRTSDDGHRTLARVKFDMADDFARRVGGQCKRGFLGSWSIRFRPLEYGPPVADELKRRPDWGRAKTIYRHTELVSFSAVILPDNKNAITIKKALRMSEHDRPSSPPAEAAQAVLEISKRIVEHDGKYTVESEDGARTFGTYDSHKQAVERLGQVEYFKHKSFAPGDHVAIHKHMGGGCGTVSKVHMRGHHLDHHGIRMDASHDEPVYGVDMHDDDHDAYGETKHFHADHMKDFASVDGQAKDFAGGDTEPVDDAPAWGGKPEPLGKGLKERDKDDDEAKSTAEEAEGEGEGKETGGKAGAEDDKCLSDALRKSLCDCAKTIKHSGEKGHGHWHDESKAVHWTMADEDKAEAGHHTAAEIEKAFAAVDGVKTCKAAREKGPEGDGWAKFWHDDKAVDQRAKSHPRTKGMSEGVGAAGGFDAHFEDQTEKTISDGQELEPQVDTIRAGHHVKFDTGRFKGVGKIASVHKGEMVPDVDDDLMGHEDDPGVKIHVYKPHGDGHKPTNPPLHVAAKMSQVEKCGRLTPPTKDKEKGKSAPVDLSARRKPYEFTPLSEEEDRRRTLEWLNGTPEGKEFIEKTIRDQFRRRRGAVC